MELQLTDVGFIWMTEQ